MASSIYTGLILFALLHLGTAYYVIQGSRSKQEATLNATLDIFKSVNKNPNTSDINEESKLLASKLSSLFERVLEMGIGSRDIIAYPETLRLVETIDLMINQSNDLKLQKAEREVNKIYKLFTTKYRSFLNNDISPNETQAMIQEALELDNEQNSEHSEAMSSLFQIYVDKYSQEVKRNHECTNMCTFRFFLFLGRYDVCNELQAFMMITTAYKLKSLESNDDNYVKEFQRLREQLLYKLEMYLVKSTKALNSWALSIMTPRLKLKLKERLRRKNSRTTLRSILV